MKVELVLNIALRQQGTLGWFLAMHSLKNVAPSQDPECRKGKGRRQLRIER
jgi:hypothetical protein